MKVINQQKEENKELININEELREELKKKEKIEQDNYTNQKL